MIYENENKKEKKNENKNENKNEKKVEMYVSIKLICTIWKNTSMWYITKNDMTQNTASTL